MKKYEGFSDLNNEEMFEVDGGTLGYKAAFKLACKFGKVGIAVFCAGAVAGALYEVVFGN